jgi:tetratricopeptide (TPR) repeat protein
MGLAAAAVGLTLARTPGRSAWILAVIGAGAAIGAAPLARLVVWFGGYGALPFGAALIGIAISYGLSAPVARTNVPVRAASLAAAAAVGVSPWLPTTALIFCTLAAVLLSNRLAPSGRSGGALAAPSGRLELAASLVLLPVALLGWALARAPIDPTPLGFSALVTGIFLGAALWHRWSWPLGVLLLGAAAAAVSLELHALVAVGVLAGPGLFAVVGVGVGLGARVVPGSANLAAAATAAAALLLFALPRVPDPIASWAVRAVATTTAHQARVEDIRGRATAVHTGLNPAGASALRRFERHLVAELDGAYADPDTRAGAAERFAGTLAACATAGRSRARIGGDDLGLAVEAVHAQGFLAVDTAVPDARFIRAQVGERPDLARIWLHPSVRLVGLPAPAVLRAGPRADAVIELVRSPWTDGRRTAPSARELRATRATLSKGGVHVLALAATGLPDGLLPWFIHEFQRVYAGASLWLPPQGGDTALLLGSSGDAALDWAGFERCFNADRAALARSELRSAVDIGALALADPAHLRALGNGRAPGPGLPSTSREPARFALGELGDLDAAPSALFAGAPAELAGRAESRALFLDMLRQSARGDMREAIQRARALASGPDARRALAPVLKPHLDRARDAMARGAREGISSKAWDEAEASLTLARAIAPDHADTRCLEGRLAAARGQFAKAEAAFEACAAADPTSLDALDGLARSRLSRGNAPGAEEALRSALRLRPDLWNTALNLGVFLLEQGRLEEAERLLEQAAAAEPEADGRPVPAPSLALARLNLERRNPKLALAHANRALTLGAGAQALALRGAAQYDLRQLDLAADDFTAALRVDPKNVLARGGLGQVQAARGDYEAAAASFRAVLETDPTHAGAREALSRLARLIEGPN